MFRPSLTQVREFFFTSYHKGASGDKLTDLEQLAFSLIIDHPEFQPILQNRAKYLNYNDWAQAGQINPFLHLSLHLSVQEQLSINQPAGVVELAQDLLLKFDSKHEVAHQIMACLAEVVRQAELSSSPPDTELYLNLLRARLNKE